MTDTKTELATVNLDFPFTRGDQTIDKVQVRRPRSGELRGLNIADLVQMNVAATAKLLPRITMPPLTDTEINNLDPADLTQFGMEIQDFLLPKAAKEQGSQD
ncbi:phage tail assembly protein [Sphingomonas faeni]|uniref:phage tail assembly protein n=1 Tax=Sphingomonas faeni TaxID=185950 RepID=UPI0033647445